MITGLRAIDDGGRQGFEPLTKVKVLIAYDHPVIRHSLRTILSSERHAVVVGEATTGVQLVEQAASLRPDLIITGPAMPKLDGVEATRRIQAVNPRVHVLIVSLDDAEATDRDEGRRIRIA